MRGWMSVLGLRYPLTRKYIDAFSFRIRFDVLTGILVVCLLGGCSQQTVSTATYDNEIPKTLLLSREQVLETLDELKQIREAIKKDSQNALLYHRAGLIEERLERWDNALWDHQMAIRRNSKFAEAYYHAGIVAEKLGESYQLNTENKDEGMTVGGPMRRYALDMYKKAVKYKSHYIDAYYRLCLAYILGNDLKNAVEAYQRLNELEPDSNRTKEALSKVYNLQQAQNQKN